MTIKEFSEISDINQNTLRYWDDIGLFRPARRGENNRYRYYLPEQVTTAIFLKMLSGLNVPLKDLEGISKNRSPKAVLRLMQQQEIALDSELYRLREAYSSIHTMCDIIEQGIRVTNPGYVSVQELGDMAILLESADESEGNINFHQGFRRYCRYVKQNRFNLNTFIGGYFESMDRFLRAPSLPSRFFSVNPQGRNKRAAGTYIVGYTHGPYGQLGDAARRLDEFAGRYALTPAGGVYVLYLLNAVTMKESASYLAQICVALSQNTE